MEKINTVKGTKDLSGSNLMMHKKVCEIFSKLCESKSFQEINTPIIENSKVFKKTLGVTSDIIQKEMYSFVDQGGEEIVLRPEGTAAVARALITNSMLDNLNKKFYYFGPMFRREKPQTGRLRQFHQVGIEIFDEKNPFNDVESILIAEKFLKLLGIRDKIKLEINTLGNLESRKNYITDLVKFLKKNISRLSSESKKKLETNPLRILDSKNNEDKEIIEESPKILNFLDDESNFFFEAVLNNLKKLNIEFSVNPYLVRGLDYYNHTAFEFVTFEDKSQNAVLAGGRYDGLVSSLGGKNLSGVGWASGIERIILNLKEFKIKKKIIAIIALSEDLNTKILEVLYKLKPLDDVVFHSIYSGSFKKKMIKANKLKSYGCVIIGNEEIKENKVIWKNMESGFQEILDLKEINEFLEKKIAN